ncbi:hypothetical protein EVAR_99676_1 [Eumeta japonica]|uniref:Uncharacterized protein n=1 Tax=Eumeta variegata TaxID=151549 RepID=A0A4C2A5W6_EUMVA|nr:hypothetical protein EVAR_99676_1 [Eumeta japonica]
MCHQAGYQQYEGCALLRWHLPLRITITEQRLRITLLDVSLRGESSYSLIFPRPSTARAEQGIGPFESECTDYVEILEANRPECCPPATSRSCRCSSPRRAASSTSWSWRGLGGLPTRSVTALE